MTIEKDDSVRDARADLRLIDLPLHDPAQETCLKTQFPGNGGTNDWPELLGVAR